MPSAEGLSACTPLQPGQRVVMYAGGQESDSMLPEPICKPA